MQESRLFKIIYYLLDKGHATAPELAAKFEVSVRTIYRDIDALSGAGVPVYAETRRNGGIYLMNDFVLDRVVLNDAPFLAGHSTITAFLFSGMILGGSLPPKITGRYKICHRK